MRLLELHIRQFRNLERISIEPPEGPVLFWGDNAQGKTNLLEAIYYLSAGRSFRTRNERECLAWDAPPDDPAVVRGTLEREGVPRELRVVLSQGEKRLFALGKPLARLAELYGQLNAVLFTPGDLELAQGGPAARRRFLDSELSQVSRPYLCALQRYAQALRQRNALLRSGRPLSDMAPDMAAYEALMAESGAEILAARRLALAELGERAAQAYARFGAGESLELRYKPFARGDSPAEQGMSDAEWFRGRLEASQAEDARLGQTRIGPHRDDFSILLDGKSAHDFASQGQQRSCALALRLAEAEWMADRTGERPILLLDDLASELDAGRRERLIEALRDAGQVFMTTTRPGDFGAGFGFAASWRVRRGELSMEREQ
ncbi:MAG: DNA replication and repair protein RecF [candidate division BRC1 bacterium ADurb.BinA364]|nr:MAG: DNA replication and repair protein RecF [candidate division BRC1 bacterium ADurb.BinA364]